jgi:UTP--glucose-1-phosphate uridylyltransferase
MSYSKLSSTPLLPSPSHDARARGSSHIDFKTATTGISAKAMRNDLSHLVGTVDDPVTKKVRIGLLLQL